MNPEHETLTSGYVKIVHDDELPSVQPRTRMQATAMREALAFKHVRLQEQQPYQARTEVKAALENGIITAMMRDDAYTRGRRGI